jgi:hypothetical protein
LPNAAQPNWQLLGNEVQKSIFESGICLAGLAAFPSLIADINKGFGLVQSGDSAGETTFRNTLNSSEQPYYDALVGFLKRGQTHFAQGQYVLKRSLTISNFFNGTLPGDGNVEALLGMGTVLNLGMPQVIATKLNSIPIPAAHSGYAWSWRQLPSQMVTTAQNRVEVSTEWWFEEWSTLLYGDPI